MQAKVARHSGAKRRGGGRVCANERATVGKRACFLSLKLHATIRLYRLPSLRAGLAETAHLATEACGSYCDTLGRR